MHSTLLAENETCHRDMCLTIDGSMATQPATIVLLTKKKKARCPVSLLPRLSPRYMSLTASFEIAVTRGNFLEWPHSASLVKHLRH